MRSLEILLNASRVTFEVSGLLFTVRPATTADLASEGLAEIAGAVDLAAAIRARTAAEVARKAGKPADPEAAQAVVDRELARPGAIEALTERASAYFRALVVELGALENPGGEGEKTRIPGDVAEALRKAGRLNPVRFVADRGSENADDSVFWSERIPFETRIAVYMLANSAFAGGDEGAILSTFCQRGINGRAPGSDSETLWPAP